MNGKSRFCTKQADHEYQQRQSEGLKQEQGERVRLMARLEQMRKEFQALVDPELARRLGKS